MLILIRLVALALLSYSGVLAIPTINVKGSKFFTSDGDQFYIKGVAYQPKSVGTNNLVKGDQCKADAQLIKELGANVVRVYSVDPTLNHDDCMNAFADAGIYVLVDMTTPNFAINRANPAWTLELRNAFAQVVDGFQKYDNLLAFIAGNEIINDVFSTAAALYVKASIADMKAYRDLMQYRKIPIGYSAADITNLRRNTQNYFDCGSSSIAADFFSYNYYGWCNDSSFTQSGYDQLYDEANGFDVPIFLSETGCNNDSRDFSDQVAMLGRQMNDRFSGNIIYEWSEEENAYGLVSYKGDTISKMGDYTRLSSQWATLTPAGVKESAYNPSLTRRACPSSKASVWEVKGDALPTLGMSGFTAPASSRSVSQTGTVTATGTGTRGAGAASITNTPNSKSSSPAESTQSTPSPPIGAIVGGVFGGLALIGLIIILLFCIRRRKRVAASKQLTSSTNSSEHPKESDLMVVGAAERDAQTEQEEKHRLDGFYGPRMHELPPNGQIPELDPRRGQIAPMPAPEMAAVGDGGARVGELGSGVDMERRNMDGDELGTAEGHGMGRGTERTGVDPSTFVQAQRRLELDWLESEEARIRAQREVLMRQNGGGGNT